MDWRRFRNALVLMANCLCCGVQGEELAASHFETQVLPILRASCIECHNAELQMADLRLDSRSAMIEGGVLEVGDAESSLLIQRLHDRDLGIIMPPSGRLNGADIAILRQWIDEGAAWPAEVRFNSTEKHNEPRALVFDIIRSGSTVDLKPLLRKSDEVDIRDHNGATPLMYAALYGSIDHFQQLLDAGADVNTTDAAGLTPLMYAVASNAAKVKTLLERGAQVQTQSDLGRTAILIAAAYAGNAETIRLLLKSGADENYADRRAWTPAVMAARTGDLRMLKQILDAGGDVNGGNAKRLSPGTPLMQAAWASDVAMTRLLLARGADKNQRSLDAALISASTHGSLKIVEMLLKAGANPNAHIVTNYIPESPLLAVCGSDAVNPRIAQTLLNRGVDVMQRDARGETPMTLAGQRGESAVVKALLAAQGISPSESRQVKTNSAASKSDVTKQHIRSLSQKSVSLLQACGPSFFTQSGCTACHQQTATSLTVALARQKGLHVDERVEQQQVKLTAFDLGRKRESFLQRIKSGGTAHRLAYLLWGLAEANYLGDEITDVIYTELAGLQRQNGSWVTDAHRPPSEYSNITATAVSLQAIQHFHPPGLAEQAKTRVRRATHWLASAKPNANAESAFRLLGLAWGGAERKLLDRAAEQLLKQQASDGGWSQLPDLPTDAYATGLSLYALAESRTVNTKNKAYQAGVAFLVHTSQPDGSWHVKSRSFAFQPYFESGFPHGQDQWISAAATGWATMALLHTLESTAP